MAKGKWLVPKQSNMDIVPNDQHGEMIHYRPVMGHKPELLTLKGLPQTFDRAQIFVQSSLENIFSQHEVSRGTNKSDIRSGDMLEILREQDVAGSSMAFVIFEEELGRLFSRILRRVQLGYKTERMIKISGKEGQYDVFAFSGADLRNNTDVTVRKDSAQPESRALRQQQVMARFESGLYGNPQDPEVRRKVMRLLDDAIVDDIYEETRQDEAYAEFENMVLLQSQQTIYLANAFDNHQVHNRIHRAAMLKLEVQKLKLENPKAYMEIFVRMSEHMKVHDDFLQQQMAQATAQAAAMKGGA
jgi:uncharacterized protein YueI